MTSGTLKVLAAGAVALFTTPGLAADCAGTAGLQVAQAQQMQDKAAGAAEDKIRQEAETKAREAAEEQAKEAVKDQAKDTISGQGGMPSIPGK